MNAAAWPQAGGTFRLGDLAVERGGVIADAHLVWQTHGTLNAARDNVILYPCSYTAQHADMAWLIGPDGILDPTRWFIVIPDMFSNGLSSGAAETPDYPAVVTSRDNVLAQRRLLAEQFAITRLAAVYGFSMGAQQAYHWAALFPEAVERAIVVCGSARTATHNRIFLSSLLRTLEAAPEHLGGGRFSHEPRAALRAFAHIYASWALSQDFYRAGLHLTALGAPDLDTFLRTDWEERYHARRAANLYAQLVTWFHGDISANPLYGDDLVAALQAIRARVLLMPGRTDLYFPVADNAAEIAHLRHAELRPIPSVWGHRAGNPTASPEDFRFLKSAVRDWLDR
ncbi:MAG: alpha/beta fold hydrolase [Rhodospirillales bacterium]|nr:alpha/beta fold hydrolase [Rhodospirillales bacterium]MDE2199413.1 alpha/beta fold hydrolase [Rhodospirillales bacterium]MDE2574242.1 alpha/beta fold hydrolase [Rhodospirillales bacterium]